MRRFLRRFAAAVSILLTAVTATGCGGLVFDPQELYSLPKLPEKYQELDNQLHAILESGAEYAAPAAGTNIQTVQMQDLDGDGREEAVAFFRNAEDEKPLKIYIFTAEGDTYRQTALIEGSGTAIYSVTYTDLDNDGRRELEVGWRVSAELQVLTVYTLYPDGPAELVRTPYVRYKLADMDNDGLQELIVFRADEVGNGIADYYGWKDNMMAARNSARISMTMAELSQQGRVTQGALLDGTPALFVTGVEDSSRSIMDILAVQSGELSNIVLSDITGVSTELADFQSLYPKDINGDSVTEAPWPMWLPMLDGGNAIFRRVDWRAYHSEGTSELVLSTFHDIEDGWYLQLPEAWRGRITVDRSVTYDETAVTFFIWSSAVREPKPFLRIIVITGSSRESRAVRGSRFMLSRQPDAICVAELLEANSAWEYGVTEDEVRGAFRLIAPEWSDGEN